MKKVKCLEPVSFDQVDIKPLTNFRPVYINLQFADARVPIFMIRYMRNNFCFTEIKLHNQRGPYPLDKLNRLSLNHPSADPRLPGRARAVGRRVCRGLLCLRAAVVPCCCRAAVAIGKNSIAGMRCCHPLGKQERPRTR